MPANLPTVSEPFPISLINNRYLLFSIDVITYVRRVHHITGVLIGSIPQIPQQNVFLGVPLQLMPEEARLLVEKGAAFIVDDAEVHNEGLRGLRESEQLKYVSGLKREGEEAARIAQARKGQKTKEALVRMNGKKTASNQPMPEVSTENATVEEEEDSTESLFSTAEQVRAPSPPPSRTPSLLSTSDLLGYAITPTTSYPPLPKPTQSLGLSLPKVPTSYPLFAHLHSHGYFISPGLRFGCQYLVYPGDPLRFHSHFLVTGMQWDEELDLLDLVGGGRLGTGVKKGFLIGGVERQGEHRTDELIKEGRVRTFCIEWGGM
ncbi:tRNA-splicing endonuclease subunit [Acarospora aff. strigata]|nr:tRNA-splicing endonuclease subunit [Acarospora aff. strigata]